MAKSMTLENQLLGERRKTRPTRVLMHALIIMFCILVILPLSWVIGLSIRDIPSSYTGQLWPDSFTFEHYPYVITKIPTMVQNILNSVMVTVAAVFLATMCAILGGYALVHLRLPGRIAVIAFLTGTLFFPARLLSLIGIYHIQRALGLMNTTPGLILPYVTLNLALSVLTMRSVFEQISTEIVEAAKMDGANSWYTLWNIMFPLVKNGLVVVIMINFVTCWGEYLLALTLIDDQAKRTFPVVLAQANSGQGQWAWSRVAAMYIIAIAPGIIGFAASQRWYMKGLTEGAIKM